MQFRQFVDDDLGCASYLIGDESSGEAVVVDPAYAIEPYLEEAEKRHVRITRVLETHTHADHVSGHGRFALEHGLPVHVHPAAEPEYPYEALADGQEISLGEVVLRVLHTPGHRPEHCCFEVIDGARGDEPWLVITGDSLLIGDAARPDLASEAVEGATGLYGSLQKLLQLPDGVELFPGHVAGSLCGAGMSSRASSTIGFERRFNHALNVNEAEFVQERTNSSTPRPPNMDNIVALNRGPFLAAQPPLGTVDSPDGASVLDIRKAREFVARPRPWCVQRLPHRLDVRDEGCLRPHGRRAGRDLRVLARGRRGGGARPPLGRALRAARVPPHAEANEKLDAIEIDELERFLTENNVEVLDVREKSERDEGYIEGTRHIPYRIVRKCLDDLPEDRPIVTICSSGARASIAASVIAAAGKEVRPVLGGGVEDWADRGGNTVQFRRCGT